MRRGTFFAPLTALALLNAGCVELPDAPGGGINPPPFTPYTLLGYFEWCYDHQDEALYAEILDPDFTGHLDGEEGGEIWGRDEELARFAELCAACGEIKLVLDLSGYEDPGPEDGKWLIPDVAYNLYAVIGDTTYLVVGVADFLTVKNEDGGYPWWRLLELRGFEYPEPLWEGDPMP